MTKEKIGEIWIFAEMMVFAAFPIIASHATRVIPPLFFAGICTLLAGIAALAYLLATRQLAELKNTRAIKYMLGAALFIAFFPQIFIFIGAGKTESLNISLLWQMEIVFTLIFCGLLYKEKVTRQKILGAVVIVIGALFILLQGNFRINLGDLFIVIATAIFPFGNMFTKEALKLVSGAAVLFVRSIIGGAMLIAISAMFETYAMPPLQYLTAFPWLFLVNGLIVLGVSKLMWYKGLRYLEIGKAISLVQSAPAFTLLYLLIFFGEIPTMYQWVGFFCILGGMFIATRKKTGTLEVAVYTS